MKTRDDGQIGGFELYRAPSTNQIGNKKASIITLGMAFLHKNTFNKDGG